MKPDNIGIIVLAAGYSRRFQSDKRQALMHDQRTVLASTLSSVPPIFSQRILVLHPGDEVLAAQFTQWQTVIANRAKEGMGESLAAGIRAASHCEGILIALGDMPFVASTTFTAVADALCTHSIVIPSYSGNRGHPVGFQRRHFPELETLSGDAGARSVVSAHASEVFEMLCSDSGVRRDIDKPGDISGAGNPGEGA